MPRVCWHPPAFLLPSWSEAQLALLRQARTRTHFSTSSAALLPRRDFPVVNRQDAGDIRPGQEISWTSNVGDSALLSLPKRDADGKLAVGTRLPHGPDSPIRRPTREENGASEDGYAGNLWIAQQQVFDLLKTRSKLKVAEKKHKQEPRKPQKPMTDQAVQTTPADVSPFSILTQHPKPSPHSVNLRDEWPADAERESSELGKDGHGSPSSWDYSSLMGSERKPHDLDTTAPKPAPAARPQRVSLGQLQGWSTDDLESTEGAPDAKTKIPSIETLQATEFIDYAFLTFRTHDNTLDLDDFLRVAPPGKHLKQWRGHGAPVQVTPVRKADTFEATGTYLLAFRDTEEAQAYQKRAAQMHRGMISASEEMLNILPGGFLEVLDEDVFFKKADWTLAPEGQPLYMYVKPAPLSPHEIELLRDKGHPELAGPEGTRSRRAVLFWIDGHRPPLKLLQKFLADDGLDRGSPWTASKSIKPFGGLESNTRNNEGTDSHGRKGEEADIHEESLYEDSPSTKPILDISRWILGFDDETEARRFVRAWHLQYWPYVDKIHNLGHGQAPVHATLLW